MNIKITLFVSNFVYAFNKYFFLICIKYTLSFDVNKSKSDTLDATKYLLINLVFVTSSLFFYKSANKYTSCIVLV